MKNKLFVLIGESCSGKSTLERQIQDHELCNRVISMTTRKPRSNERDGIDYYFVDNLVFNTYKARGKFLEVTSYTMKNQGFVQYATLRQDINLNEGNYICVLNPNGYEQVMESLGKENVVGIYINRDPKERFLSYLDRENENFYNLLEEARTRLHRDLKDFAGIETKVDYTITNTGIEDMLLQFLEILNTENYKN